MSQPTSVIPRLQGGILVLALLASLTTTYGATPVFSGTLVEASASQAPAANLSQSLSSWHTENSARYARIYETYEAEQAGNAVTIWDNGTYAQTVPAYSGVQAIRYSADWVYLETTGLSAGHVMGPWYNDTGPGGSEQVFENWPEAIFTTYRVPTQPVIPETKSEFPAAAIGLMVDGTIIFSSSDTFSWDGATDSDTGPGGMGGGRGTGVWNHDAYITESNTFDRSNAHAAGNALHYHASPMKVRHLLGDSVDAVELPSGAIGYVDNFNGRHSPILGWMADGLPLYGPYGYSDPMDANSAVRRMVTGFIVRDGDNGTYDIPTNGRDRLPDWAVRFQGIGPVVSGDNTGPDHATIAVPYFMEDYDFKGDLAGYSYYDDGGAGSSGGGGATFIATFTGPALPPQDAISSVTVGGVTATSFTRDSDTQLTIQFDDSTLAPGSYNAEAKFTPPGGSEMTLVSTNQYTKGS